MSFPVIGEEQHSSGETGRESESVCFCQAPFCVLGSSSGGQTLPEVQKMSDVEGEKDRAVFPEYQDYTLMSLENDLTMDRLSPYAFGPPPFGTQ